MKNLTGGGAPRSISRLAAAPRRSCTKVHFLAFLTAKRDIASRMHPPMQTSVFVYVAKPYLMCGKIVFLIDLEKFSQKLGQCLCFLSEESDGFAVDEFDCFGVGNFWESRHGHDVAEVDYDEAAAAFDFDIAHGDVEVGRNVEQRGII